jgi:hypothetical protein
MYEVLMVKKNLGKYVSTRNSVSTRMPDTLLLRYLIRKLVYAALSY